MLRDMFDRREDRLRQAKNELECFLRERSPLKHQSHLSHLHDVELSIGCLGSLFFVLAKPSKCIVGAERCQFDAGKFMLSDYLKTALVACRGFKVLLALARSSVVKVARPAGLSHRIP